MAIVKNTLFYSLNVIKAQLLYKKVCEIIVTSASLY